MVGATSRMLPVASSPKYDAIGLDRVGVGSEHMQHAWPFIGPAQPVEPEVHKCLFVNHHYCNIVPILYRLFLHRSPTFLKWLHSLTFLFTSSSPLPNSSWWVRIPIKWIAPLFSLEFHHDVCVASLWEYDTLAFIKATIELRFLAVWTSTQSSRE